MGFFIFHYEGTCNYLHNNTSPMGNIGKIADLLGVLVAHHVKKYNSNLTKAACGDVLLCVAAMGRHAEKDDLYSTKAAFDDHNTFPWIEISIVRTWTDSLEPSQ
ncbi:hypothetical protein QJS10_CPA09g00049 [Acorus calamus]|uniref:Uncharacterized protein n=1 Tax=Acorus calamus TaxID=4465 RepID=A0AAV9E4R3_ACOCL|nr:hypothetical protein QJS10_CPA09g00049 [Acorus calamus]